MIDPPDHLLDPPQSRATPMDALSEVLRAMHLTGGVFLDAEFTADWCISAKIGPEDCRPFLPEPAHVIAYHYVVAGRLLVLLDGEPPVSVEGGDIVMMPHNDEHRLASGPDLPPVDVDGLIQPASDGGLARIVHGGGGERVHMLCGFLGSDTKANPILAALPKVLKHSAVNAAAGDWVASSFRFAAHELAAGSATMLAKLSELLFAEAVRRYVAALPPEQAGWLAGLRDPAVGRALALLHGRPTDTWTAAQLSREAGLSRSAFAERFTALVGVPPMRYLTRWRMQLAAERLRDGRQPISRIAYEVGYESEAAFNRAFKREFGTPPAAWRKESQGT